MFNPRTMKPAQSYELEFDVSIRAPRDRVWDALTAETTKWWPAEFFTSENPAEFIIEPVLGGRVYEDWGNGAGVLWGNVVVWIPTFRMTWACDMYPDTTGPGRSYITFNIEEKGLETIVRVQDAGICINPNQIMEIGTGWQRLIGTHFKAYVESTVFSGPSMLDSGPLSIRLGQDEEEDLAAG